MSCDEPWRPRRRTVTEVEESRSRSESRSHEPAAPSLDVLQAGLVHLMSRYAAEPCPGVAAAVVEHLTALCRHPQQLLIPVQRKVYAGLLNEWRCRLPCCGGRAAGGMLH